MAKTDLAAKALANGQQQAKRVLELRDKALQSRQSALDNRARDLGATSFARAVAQMVSPELIRALGSDRTAGVLVAEGDSWFDYPWTDILAQLEDEHGYDVESVAHRGDRVEDMAYSDGQLVKFTRRIEKLLRNSKIPRAILLSGGGNDVAGEEFYTLLNHASSAAPGLNASIVDGVINQRIKLAYITILSAVTKICEERIGRSIPILVHGYDYPVPDGRGFLGGWWILPGPWLAPGFQVKGYTDIKQRKKIAKDLIDTFNKMIAEVAAMPAFSHVQYIDLRNTLSTGADYKKWWGNELHPTITGFDRVADRFSAVLNRQINS
jgi:lysophospholipase L1-like esterase